MSTSSVREQNRRPDGRFGRHPHSPQEGDLGPDASEAWSGSGFTDRDRWDWSTAGAPDAAAAAGFRDAGFTPAGASPWLREGFDGPTAQEWMSAGCSLPEDGHPVAERTSFDPDEAAVIAALDRIPPSTDPPAPAWTGEPAYPRT